MVFNSLPLKEGMANNFNKFKFPLPKNALCQVKIAEVESVKSLRTDIQTKSDQKSSLELSSQVS